MAAETTSEQLAALSGGARVRLTRVIVYEGSVNWVRATYDRNAVSTDGPRFVLSTDKSLVCTEEKLEVL